MKLLSRGLAALTFVIGILFLGGCGRSAKTNPSVFIAGEWQEKMNNSSLSQDEFTELYAQFLRVNLKEADVVVSGELQLTVAFDGGKWKISLDNLWNEAANNPASRASICQSHLNKVLAMVQKRPGVTGPAETNSVVPTIRSDAFLSQYPNDDADRKMVSERLVADLNIVYATDREGMIAFLMESDRTRFNLDSKALRDLAVSNLKRVIQPIQQRKNDTVFMLTTGDGYSSSLLLLDDYWQTQTNSVKGDVVAVVPARDILFFTGSDSVKGIQQLKQIAADIYAKGDHVISTTLLRRRDNRWEKFVE